VEGLRRGAADEALRQTPVIMVSVMSERRDRKQMFASSKIDSYFTKPFDTRRLRVEIERMLGASLWDMPEFPPLRSATQAPSSTGEFTPPVDPKLADQVQSGKPEDVTQTGMTTSVQADAAPDVQVLDDTQPALPLSPLRPSRPVRRSAPLADAAPDDSAASHEEASADT
jgi:hypothetical protein